MKSRIEKLESKLEEKDVVIIKLSKKVDDIMNSIEKELVVKLFELQKLIEDKDLEIKEIEEKIQCMETNQETCNIHEEEEISINESDTLEKTFINPSSEEIQCDVCEFVAKNIKGLRIHKRLKHTKAYGKISSSLFYDVQVDVLCLATEAYLGNVRDYYKSELGKSEEFYNVLDIYMDIKKSKYNNIPDEYVGKLIPTKIKFLTENPEKWEDPEERKIIWKEFNRRIAKGKISEEDES